METNNPYEIVLADLRSKREEIDKMIESIERFMLLSGGTPSTTLSQSSSLGGEVSPDSFFGLSIADAAKKLLEMKKKPLKANEITENLEKGGIRFTTGNPTNTVMSVLSRHVNSDNPDIVKVSRGLFGLAKWYPNAGRFKQKQTNKNILNQIDANENLDSAVINVSDLSE